jgi:hypothetical protein
VPIKAVFFSGYREKILRSDEMLLMMLLPEEISYP